LDLSYLDLAEPERVEEGGDHGDEGPVRPRRIFWIALQYFVDDEIT
jgi:hypothetical protein